MLKSVGMDSERHSDTSRVTMTPDQFEEHVQRAKGILEKDNEELSPFWIKKYKTNAARNWDIFYKRNTTKFFKDRHWTNREFEELALQGGDHETKCLEVGCGVGNFMFPALDDNPQLFIHACDFSTRAVDMVKSNEKYNENRCKAFVCDITTDNLTDNIPPDNLDLVTALFVFSAIPPEKFAFAVQNIFKTLKPGGLVLFRDYGLYDEAQLRFSASSDKKRLDQNFYVRHDGTMSYFFSTDELQSLFEAAGFETVTNQYIYRETTNRRFDLRVDRIFVQAKFQKRRL